MKLCHLAPRHAINRIRRHGLHMGGGVRGKGVYAVPLLELDVENGHARVSSSQLWRFLFRKENYRHKHCAAIIFSPPACCWPGEIFFTFSPRQSREFLRHLDAGLLPGCHLPQKEHDIMKEIAEHDFFGGEAGIHVANEKALAAFMAWIIRSGWMPTNRCSDALELVLRCPVPPSAIRRIVPLYQTSAEFRAGRDPLLN